MFSGVYINLDRRPDRLAHMQRELSRFSLTDHYRRLPAISQPNGVVGCYRSHLRALEEARRAPGIVHILEDDSLLSAKLASFIKNEAPALLETYDLLFLDMWIDQKPETVKRYQAVLDNGGGVLSFGPGGPRIAATSSYLVSPRRVARLHHLVRKHAASGMPIDATYDYLAKTGECAAAVVVPFLTGVDMTQGVTSDIQPLPAVAQRMFVALRTRFFVDPTRQPAL